MRVGGRVRSVHLYGNLMHCAVLNYSGNSIGWSLYTSTIAHVVAQK